MPSIHHHLVRASPMGLDVWPPLFTPSPAGLLAAALELEWGGAFSLSEALHSAAASGTHLVPLRRSLHKLKDFRLLASQAIDSPN